VQRTGFVIDRHARCARRRTKSACAGSNRCSVGGGWHDALLMELYDEA
jgi:hypothetical protein